MKNLLVLFFSLITFLGFSQIKGKVVGPDGKPLAAVSIHIENTYIGTSSNEAGQYSLKQPKQDNFTIVFQFLGYKSQKIEYTIDKNSKDLDVQLEEDNILLNTIVIDKKNNPANEVIRNAIAHKRDNSETANAFKADFYSRGIFRIKEAPEKILGKKIDFFDEVLDSTRSGILYLSETVSKITYKKPDKLKEVIIASKVSGKDNGFSFNSAASANFDFYDNYLAFQTNVVSPIADNAFNYYKYKLEGTFFDQNNVQINKIKVIPKRTSEPVMEGYLYIVEDSWAIYAVDLSVKGSQINTPVMNSLTLKQNFSYNNQNKIWVKNTQTLDFIAGMMGINISGRFTYVYSNYEFEPQFDKKTFTREILTFEKDANKKDDTYWQSLRPVPLTSEESTDYLKKDLLQTKKKSKAYLDSIDKKTNKLEIADIVLGYEYKNSFKKWGINYEGLIKGFSFNTVQGFALSPDIGFSKRNEETRTYSAARMNFDYGLSEKKFRSYITYVNKFSNLTQSEFRFAAGSMVAQFNYDNPISKLVNSISTLFFKDNYKKMYERNFINACFERELFNGFTLNTEINYSERKPLFNTTDRVIIKRNKEFTSNNPLLPDDELTPAIVKHNLVKGYLGVKINFGQEYWLRPDGKFNIGNDKYPVLYLNYEKGFAGTEDYYNFDHLSARLSYDFMLSNKGNIDMNIKAGKFYNAERIAFVDYKHFNGNQTYIGKDESYMNTFNLLPYYSSSTNDAYLEIHVEHDDNGFIMNKIPLLNKLQSTLVLGYHNLSIPKRSPYQEYTVGLNNLGFGKIKIFRLDYIHSFQSGHKEDGVIFGLKFLNLLD